jgi:hypothetical protein
MHSTFFFCFGNHLPYLMRTAHHTINGDNTIPNNNATKPEAIFTNS